MTDVRLTATNPEDSSVVPVACNAKGELILEEPTLASDDYVAVTGDNMTGDLTLNTNKITLNATSGNAEFNGDGLFNNIGDNYRNRLYGGGFISALDSFDADSTGVHFEIGDGGSANPPEMQLIANSGASGDALLIERQGQTSPDIKLKYDGSAQFLSNVRSNSGFLVYPSSDEGYVFASRNAANDKWTAIIQGNGAAQFAGDVIVSSRNKAWMLVEQNGLCHMVEQLRATTADLVEPVIEYPPLRDVFAELDAIEKALGEVMDKLRMAPPAGWEVWDGSSENS